MEITINDLWPGLKKQMDVLVIDLMDFDPIMVRKIESVLHHYEFNVGDNQIKSIFAPINDINSMLSGKEYFKNIDATEDLKAKLDKFRVDVDMFVTILTSKYYEIEQRNFNEQLKDERKETVKQLSSQEKRNEHIYDEVDADTLDNAIVEDKLKRKEISNKIFAKSKNVKENVDKLAEKLDEKLANSKKAKKNEEVKQ